MEIIIVWATLSWLAWISLIITLVCIVILNVSYVNLLNLFSTNLTISSKSAIVVTIPNKEFSHSLIWFVYFYKKKTCCHDRTVFIVISDHENIGIDTIYKTLSFLVYELSSDLWFFVMATIKAGKKWFPQGWIWLNFFWCDLVTI